MARVTLPNINYQDSIGFWRWCMIFRITGVLDFVHRPGFYKIENWICFRPQVRGVPLKELTWILGRLLSKSESKTKVTLRLAVYSQSVRLGVKLLEIHDQRFSFCNWALAVSPHVTSSLTRGWVCLLWICLTFVKCTFRKYNMSLKMLHFALHTSPLSVQALQSTSCLSYIYYSITAAWSLQGS
jgi:hypothetical protein